MKTKTILGLSIAAVFAVSMIFSTDVLAAGSHLAISQEDSKYQVNDKGVGKLLIHTEGKIPTDGSAAAFGYGVVTGVNMDGNPENVLALTTHKCVSDHPFQSNATDVDCPSSLGVLTLLTNGALQDADYDGAEMHAHILDLKPATQACIDAGSPEMGGLEVDIIRSLEGIPTSVLPGNPFYDAGSPYQANNLVAGATGGYDIKVVGPNLQVRQIPSSDLAGTDAIAIVSFGIVPLDNGDLTPAMDGIPDHLCLT